MKTSAFIVLIVVLVKTSTASYIFLDDLQYIRNGFLQIFQYKNSMIQAARYDFSEILTETVATAQNRLVQTLTVLRTEEAQLQIQLDRENPLSVCIQNLQSLMDNTLSLSGFRLSNCAVTFESEYNFVTSIAANNLHQLQLVTNNFPFLFMNFQQGLNVLNEEQEIIDTLQERLLDERLVFNDWSAPRNVTQILRTELDFLNKQYESCTGIAISHFASTIVTLEQRIGSICNALE